MAGRAEASFTGRVGCCCAAGAVVTRLGSAALRAARTSLVTSSPALTFSEAPASIDQVRAAALHDLVDHRAKLGVDLLLDVLLVALDLLLLAAQFLVGAVLLGLQRADAGSQCRVGLLAVERIDGGLNAGALGLQRVSSAAAAGAAIPRPGPAARRRRSGRRCTRCSPGQDRRRQCSPPGTLWAAAGAAMASLRRSPRLWSGESSSELGSYVE